MMKISKTAVIAGLCFFALLCCHQLNVSEGRELSLRSPRTEMKTYTQKDIERTVPHLEGGFHPRLLVFDGEAFAVYNINHSQKSYTSDATFGRSLLTVPLMVRAIYQQFPDRFREGQPIFQMLFLDSDSISSQCDSPNGCNEDASSFAPIPIFGSVPKVSSLPFKAFPNWFYIQCLFEYKVNNVKQCHWQESEEMRESFPFDDLLPQVIWRGSGFPFLPAFEEFKCLHAAKPDGMDDPATTAVKLTTQYNELTPRWRAVTLCAQARMDKLDEKMKPHHWIDAKFTGHGMTGLHQHLKDVGVPVMDEIRMTPNEMARYKYQLAIGGGGGTAWRGTISKLGMPGLLLQQETPTMDWFYDEIKPFQHYVPVDWALSELHSRYTWAERNPKKAKKIADGGTKLHSYLMSSDYMEKIYEELFVDYLGKIVQNYDSAAISRRDAKAQYGGLGFMLQKVSICNDAHCRTRDSTGVWNQQIF